MKNDFHRLEHEHDIYADNELFFKKIIEHKNFYIDENIIKQEEFEVFIDSNFKNLKIELFYTELIELDLEILI